MCRCPRSPNRLSTRLRCSNSRRSEIWLSPLGCPADGRQLLQPVEDFLIFLDRLLAPGSRFSGRLPGQDTFVDATVGRGGGPVASLFGTKCRNRGVSATVLPWYTEARLLPGTCPGKCPMGDGSFFQECKHADRNVCPVRQHAGDSETKPERATNDEALVDNFWPSLRIGLLLLVASLMLQPAVGQ